MVGVKGMSAALGTAIALQMLNRMYGAKQLYSVKKNGYTKKVYPKRPKKRYRKRKWSNRRAKRSKRVGQFYDLKKKLKRVEQKANAGLGILIHRRVELDKVQAGESTVVYGEQDVNTLTQLEASIAKCRYYDAGSNSIVTQNQSSLTSYSKFFFKKTYVKVLVRANYQTDVQVDVYYWQAKEDTSITSDNARTSGLTDVGGPSGTSVSVYPTDSELLKSLYKCRYHKKVLLKAGKEMTFNMDLGSFNYDRSLTDSHPDTYQERYKAGQVMFRVCGALAHDAGGTAQYGRNDARIDYEMEVVHVLEYEAGAKIKTVAVTDGRSSFTTGGGILTQAPIADLQNATVN